jgi:hypothetical protein
VLVFGIYNVPNDCPYKYDDTDSTANHREVKYKELRAKETKLKKMEELIKQKEKAAQEVNNNKTKLESRCQELGAIF